MIKITHALPEDRDEVTQFMFDGMPRVKWDMEGWRRILANRWGAPDDSYAIIARDDGRLVGVLGLISARRPTADGTARTANMTSWYILGEYRGRGLGTGMLDLLMADEDVTITNLTSAKAAVPVVTRAGFKVLDDRRRVWRRAGTCGLNVHAAPLEIADRLDPRDVQVLRDHAGLNLKTFAVDTPDGPCVLVIALQKRHDAYVTYEVLYVGDGAVFSRHPRAIADSVLPPEGAVLSVDSRYLPADVAADATEIFDIPRFYSGGILPLSQIDTLYSEIVLLDLKLY